MAFQFYHSGFVISTMVGWYICTTDRQCSDVCHQCVNCTIRGVLDTYFIVVQNMIQATTFVNHQSATTIM